MNSDHCAAGGGEMKQPYLTFEELGILSSATGKLFNFRQEVGGGYNFNFNLTYQ